MDVYNLKPMDSLFSPLSEYNNQLHSPPSFANAHPEIFYNEVQTEPDQLVSQLAIIQAHQQQIHSNQLLLNRQFQQQQQADDGPPGPSINNRKLGLYKTELCRSWEEKGTCRYGCKCQFAHGQDELRDVPRHPKFKTQLCATYWHSGSCPYGKRCCFIHSTFPHGANANGAPPLPLSEEEPTMTVSPRQSFTQTPTMHSLSLTPNTSTDSPPKNGQAEQYTPSLLSRIGERQRAGSTPSLSTSLDSNLSSPPPMSKTNSLNSFQFGEAPIYGLGLGFTNNKFDEFSLGFKNSL